VHRHLHRKASLNRNRRISRLPAAARKERKSPTCQDQTDSFLFTVHARILQVVSSPLARK